MTEGNQMLARVEHERKWFVLLTEPQMERRANVHLIARGFKTFLPEELTYGRRGLRRRKVEITRPIFRGYLFIRLSLIEDDWHWDKITSVTGIHRFMRINDDFAVIPDRIMERVERVSDELMKPKEFRGPSALFSPGEQVRIGDGPFIGLTAEIDSLDDGQRITILLSLLGRESRVQMDAEQLEKL